ncbi:MAG: Fic family protein [Puniceicoccales bacterium]|nr:Fic family protein [Puniceicoccales bacterium]
MNTDPKKAYNALPDLPPAGSIETAKILKAVIGARNALQEVKDACRTLPNPDVLVNTLPILEARDSSEIENVVTTADELFCYDIRRPGENDRNAKEAHNYCSALYRGIELLRGGRPICTNTALAIAEVLNGAPVTIRRRGVTLANAGTGEVYYTPPDDEEVIIRKLKNWENFLHQNELDALVRLAIGHYQFEAIHPFYDGNGRTGRILNLLLLVRDGFLNAPILYLSRHILRRRKDYYLRLRRVTFENDWEPWILFMLEAIHQTSLWTAEKIAQIHSLMVETEKKLRAKLPKLYSPRLMEVLFSQPYCRIRNLVEAGIAKRQTAAKYIDALVAAEILSPRQKGGPEKLYANETFFEVLLRQE